MSKNKSKAEVKVTNKKVDKPKVENTEDQKETQPENLQDMDFKKLLGCGG